MLVVIMYVVVPGYIMSGYVSYDLQGTGGGETKMESARNVVSMIYVDRD